MPALNWNVFNSLPGSKNQNFEDLCRALIRLHYGQYGEFSALKNQPSVEFHLRLINKCSLGEPARWFGWQCKVLETRQGGNLTAAGRRNIEESLGKAKTHLPGLTDWALWTPFTLSRQDQEWFKKQKTKLRLHLWTDQDIDTYLNGPGQILRNTYFGDLVITPENLEQQRLEAIQPIKTRWFPVHQSVSGERTIRRMLGEPESWAALADLGAHLKKAADSIEKGITGCSPKLKQAVAPLISTCRTISDTLLTSYQHISEDFELVRQRLPNENATIDDKIRAAVRRLRALNLPVALDATNALDDMRIAQVLLSDAREFLELGIVAFLADAGGGKTQLAAQLTVGQSGRPAGILLHGRDLHRGENLDDLASYFTLNGNAITSIAKLLAALDAAGKRANCRLPLVIDGLNEAENPKDWNAPLARLVQTLKAHPNVLVVCTLRTGERKREDTQYARNAQATERESFAVMALPPEIRKIESEGFGGDVNEAIKKYFSYFKIDSGDAEIPTELFRHPLTLRIFCEVTNPSREEIIRVEYFPASLTSLFDKYLTAACARIASLVNLGHTYTANEVANLIFQLGIRMWEGRNREINEYDFRTATNDYVRDWNSSIVNLLAQEGIIFRNPGDSPGQYLLTFTYDALAGFIIANSLLANYPRDFKFEWLKENESIEAFSGDKSHALSSDIFRSLATLCPRRMNGIQLWKAGPEQFRNVALIFAAGLDPEWLDEETTTELKSYVMSNSKNRAFIFHRFQETRGVTKHPLNAEFLDRTLRQMSVADRDLSWSEWVRGLRRERINDLISIEQKWIKELVRTPSDRLRVQWVKWLLTSTDHELRDIATRTLYWYGRGEAEHLFDITIDSLGLNDPYIPERMVAASYGVAMALHSEVKNQNFRTVVLPQYARRLYESLFSAGAQFATYHFRLREYATRTIELAVLYSPHFFTDEELVNAKSPYPSMPRAEWDESKLQKDEIHGRESPFRMDFENYTLGRLVPGRRNYDYKNEGYKKVRAQVAWRVEQLGWVHERFGPIDNSIEENQFRPRIETEGNKTDRYGKKYSWIAFLERFGMAYDQGLIEDWQEPRMSMDIDPSFPNAMAEAHVVEEDFLGDKRKSTEKWIANVAPPDVTPYLRIKTVDGKTGPWIVLDGSINQEDDSRGQKIFLFIRSFLVPNTRKKRFIARLSRQDLGNRWLPEKPSATQAYAGEIPWCSTFQKVGLTKFSFVANEEKIKVTRIKRDVYLDGKPLEEIPPALLRKLIHQIKASGSETSDQNANRVHINSVPYEAEELRVKRVKYSTLIPVCDIGWGSEERSVVNSAGSAVTLVREITEALGLSGKPQSFDLFTTTGEQVTLNTSNFRDDFNNRHSMFFIREKSLCDYLNRNGLTLVWAIWGERERSIINREKPPRGLDYKVFSRVLEYRHKSLKKV